jgi:hypothetical protein
MFSPVLPPTTKLHHKTPPPLHLKQRQTPCPATSKLPPPLRGRRPGIFTRYWQPPRPCQAALARATSCRTCPPASHGASSLPPNGTSFPLPHEQPTRKRGLAEDASSPCRTHSARREASRLQPPKRSLSSRAAAQQRPWSRSARSNQTPDRARLATASRRAPGRRRLRPSRPLSPLPPPPHLPP